MIEVVFFEVQIYCTVNRVQVLGSYPFELFPLLAKQTQHNLSCDRYLKETRLLGELVAVQRPESDMLLASHDNAVVICRTKGRTEDGVTVRLQEVRGRERRMSPQQQAIRHIQCGVTEEVPCEKFITANPCSKKSSLRICNSLSPCGTD